MNKNIYKLISVEFEHIRKCYTKKELQRYEIKIRKFFVYL